MNLPESIVGATVIETIIGTIVGGLFLAAILAITRLIWKNRGFLASKIKSVALFFHLPEIKAYFSDICQRGLQTRKSTNSQPSLQDYIQSFGSWKSQSGSGIPILSIDIGGETKTYRNITSIRASRIDPFTPFYSLTINGQESPNVNYSDSILGIKESEIFKVAKLCYFQEIVGN